MLISSIKNKIEDENRETHEDCSMAFGSLYPYESNLLMNVINGQVEIVKPAVKFVFSFMQGMPFSSHAASTVAQNLLRKCVQ